MKNLSRRSFLHKVGIGAGTAATALVLPHSLSLAAADFKLHDGKKLNIALCGLGRYAGYLADSFKDTQYCRLAGIKCIGEYRRGSKLG